MIILIEPGAAAPVVTNGDEQSKEVKKEGANGLYGNTVAAGKRKALLLLRSYIPSLFQL